MLPLVWRFQILQLHQQQVKYSPPSFSQLPKKHQDSEGFNLPNKDIRKADNDHTQSEPLPFRYQAQKQEGSQGTQEEKNQGKDPQFWYSESTIHIQKRKILPLTIPKRVSDWKEPETLLMSYQAVDQTKGRRTDLVPN